MTIAMSICVSLCLLGPSVHAADEPEECDSYLRRIKNIQLHRDFSSDGLSYFAVHPYDSDGLVYRDFLTNPSGLFMVYNSYGEGPDSDMTGAREFYFFPRVKKCIDYTVDPETQKIKVHLANGDYFVFDQDTASIEGAENGTVEVSKNVNTYNNGGVEFSSYGGLMLDVGFALGSVPSDNQTGNSIFRDEYGTTCNVRNTSIFMYSNNQASFKFSDRQLKNFLSKKCPQLRVRF
jgi:hypothetical protein